MKNIGVILAGGLSKSFHSLMPKQYLKVNGKEVVYYSIMAFRHAKKIDKIILVLDHHGYEDKYIENKFNVECIEGGEFRNESIYNALKYIKEHYPDCENVIFHDSARPFIKASVFDDLIDILSTGKLAAVTTSNISDSVGDCKNLSYIERRNQVLIQTPEAFNFNFLYKHFDKDKHYTAIAHQVSEYTKVFQYHYNGFNFKITYPTDIFLAEQFMRINFTTHNDIEAFDSNLLKGKKVLLLGGSGGMGSALRDYFDHYEIEYLSPKADEMDLSSISYEDFKKICKDFNPDIMINTAGVSISDNDGIISTFDTVFAVNLKSNLYLIELAKELNKEVHIVLTSSSSSTMGRAGITNYSASKAALNSVVESQSEVLHEQNIYLNAVVPEKVNTPMIQKLHKTNINTRELLEVDEVIEVILKYSVNKEYGKLVHIRKGL